MKKNEKIEDIEIKDNNVEENVDEVSIPHDKLEDEKNNKFLKVLKIILLVITAPIWLPWKLLFVRRKGHKFKDVSTPIKVFRVLRSPITLPLKFIVFTLIIGLEIFVGYKIRFSPVTYPITRASVHNYYLQKSSKSLMGINEVDAIVLSDHYDEFKTAFDYIDKWDMDSKNKMYVILDAQITKFYFQLLDDKTTSHLFDRFNNDEDFREDIRLVVKNINKSLNRIIKELPKEVSDSEEIEDFLKPATNMGGMIDYRQVLDIAWSGVDSYLKLSDVDIEELKMDSEDADLEVCDVLIDAIIYYSKGYSRYETYDYLEDKYVNYTDNTTTTSNEIIMSHN